MIMKVNRNQLLIDAAFLIASLFLIIGLDNKEANLPYIGYLLVPVGFYMLYKCRKNRMLAYIMLIISMVSISLGTFDMIQLGEGVSEWQSAMLRSREYNMMAAKSILLFMTVLNLFLGGELCEEQNTTKDLHDLRVNNPLVASIIIVVLVAILAYGFAVEIPKHLASSYASVDSPIFEYSIELYILAWLCSKDSKIINRILIIYALIFSVAFFFIGDRSSASMYLLFLLVTKYKGKLTYLRMIGVALGAIVFFNAIAVFRHMGTLPLSELMSQLWKRGLYQDTASWAYYASLAIIALSYSFPSRWTLFKGFLLSLIGMGNEYSSLTLFAKSYSSQLTNNGGGIFPTFFYAWLRFPGVIICAILLGLLIRKVFVKPQGVKLFYELLMIVFCIRWYVYTPVNLFRSVLIVGGILYIAYSLVVKHNNSKALRMEK